MAMRELDYSLSSYAAERREVEAEFQNRFGPVREISEISVETMRRTLSDDSRTSSAK